MSLLSSPPLTYPLLARFLPSLFTPLPLASLCFFWFFFFPTILFGGEENRGRHLSIVLSSSYSLLFTLHFAKEQKKNGGLSLLCPSARLMAMHCIADRNSRVVFFIQPTTTPFPIFLTESIKKESLSYL